jgi:hypothetical protein
MKVGKVSELGDVYTLPLCRKTCTVEDMIATIHKNGLSSENLSSERELMEYGFVSSRICESGTVA